MNDLSGQKYGKMTVIKTFRDNDRVARCVCKCDCGKEKIVRASNLRNGTTRSCGCLIKENTVKANKKYNPFVISDDFAVFKTFSGTSFIVDAEDVNAIKDVCWSVNANGYLAGFRNGKTVILHRVIMNCESGEIVDHINGDKLDNRKQNLRIVTNQENCMNRKIVSNNTSGTTGVYWNKTAKKWQAQIVLKQKFIYLGCFDNKEDAIKARKEAEKIYFGEFAYKGSV